jgi:hypothetical protein
MAGMIPGRKFPERREPIIMVGNCVCGVGGSWESHRQRIVQCRDRVCALANLVDCQSTVQSLIDYRCKVERCLALDKARERVSA